VCFYPEVQLRVLSFMDRESELEVWKEERRGPDRGLGRRDGVVRQGWHGSVVGLGKIGFWGREVAGPDWLRGGREL
jgi:hypothetical protein